MNRYGKKFYKSDDKKDLPDKIRQKGLNEFVDIETGKSVIINEESLQRYIAISPIFQASLVKIKTNSLTNVYKILLEPYNRNRIVEDSDFVYGVAVNVYEAMYSGIVNLAVNQYSYPANTDSEKLNSEYGDGGEQSNIMYFYYDDSVYDVLKAIDKDQDFELLDHIYNTIIPKESMPIFKCISNFERCMNAAIDTVLNTLTMDEDEVQSLIGIVKTNSIDNKFKLDALDKLVRFQNRIDTYTIDNSIPNTLFVLEYSDKLDLDEIKNENRLYTILIVRTLVGIEGKAYVVMYKEPPIAYRPSTNTGFTPEELSKLLL